MSSVYSTCSNIPRHTSFGTGEVSGRSRQSHGTKNVSMPRVSAPALNRATVSDSGAKLPVSITIAVISASSRADRCKHLRLAMAATYSAVFGIVKTSYLRRRQTLIGHPTVRNTNNGANEKSPKGTASEGVLDSSSLRGRCLVCVDDGGGDATTVAHGVPVRARPFADRTEVDVALGPRSLTTSSRTGGTGRTSGIDVRRERLVERVGVTFGEVDFVRTAVDREGDLLSFSFFENGAVKVIGELSNVSGSHEKRVDRSILEVSQARGRERRTKVGPRSRKDFSLFDTLGWKLDARGITIDVILEQHVSADTPTVAFGKGDEHARSFHLSIKTLSDPSPRFAVPSIQPRGSSAQ